jgi:hypothetical protein
MSETFWADIQVLNYDFQQINDPNYLKVHTYPEPTDPSVRLALIEWIKTDSAEVTNTKLVDRCPMSHVDAMAVANLFAEKNGVPVIYERMDPVR